MRLLTILFLLLSLRAHAQQEPENYKAVTCQLIHVYNEGSYAEFRAMFSDLMLKDVPAEELAAIFDSMKPRYGKLDTLLFRSKDTTGVLYKGRFENGVLMVRLKADSSGKISALEFLPYVQPNAGRNGPTPVKQDKIKN